MTGWPGPGTPCVVTVGFELGTVCEGTKLDGVD